MDEAERAAHIAKLVAAMSPPTPEEREAMRRLLGDAARAAAAERAQARTVPGATSRPGTR